MSVMGTFAWMAPEVINANLFSKGSDVWAYGVVCWELLTAQVPYAGVEVMAVAYGIATHRLALPVPATCPAFYGQLLQQCWQRDPHARPPFRAIVRLLHQPAAQPFAVTPRHSFLAVQAGWHREIEARFDELAQQELSVLGREEELRSLEDRQSARQAELDSRERQLRELESALRDRER
jgi:serine/threonine protein kinase